MITISIILSAIPPIAWFTLITIIVILSTIYYSLKFLWIKIHTIAEPISMEVDVREDSKVSFVLYKEKYGESIVYRVVSDKEIARFQMPKVTESITQGQNNNIYFHTIGRAMPDYASYENGKVTYSKDKK